MGRRRNAAPRRRTAKHVVGPPPNSIVPDGAAHPLVGDCRLIDGTRIHIAAKKNHLGDPIRKTIVIGGRKVEVDAVGVVGIRLNDSGKPDAFAAGGLKRIATDGFTLELPKRADIAFWHDENGNPHGAIQDWTGPLPKCLTDLTGEWLQLRTRHPFQPKTKGLLSLFLLPPITGILARKLFIHPRLLAFGPPLRGLAAAPPC